MLDLKAINGSSFPFHVNSPIVPNGTTFEIISFGNSEFTLKSNYLHLYGIKTMKDMNSSIQNNISDLLKLARKFNCFYLSGKSLVIVSTTYIAYQHNL